MKKLYYMLLATFFALVLIAGLLSVAAFGFYQFYLKPQPAQFEFSRDVSTITSVEIVKVNKVGDDQFEFTPLETISDTEKFLSDFKAIECTKGMSTQAIMGFSKLDNIQAIKITYDDKNFEVITPYGNIDSAIFTPDLTLEDLLRQEFFMFDEIKFNSLIDKYSSK